MPFNNFNKKIIALEMFDISKEIMVIIKENEDTILSLIRGQMGSKGTRYDGKFIRAKYGNAYRDSTVFEKERHGIGLGKKTDFITMFMKGEFYASLKMSVSGSSFSVTSDVPYFKEISSWNDDMLLGLDKYNLKYFRDEYIIPGLQRRFKELSK